MCVFKLTVQGTRATPVIGFPPGIGLNSFDSERLGTLPTQSNDVPKAARGNADPRATLLFEPNLNSTQSYNVLKAACGTDDP